MKNFGKITLIIGVHFLGISCYAQPREKIDSLKKLLLAEKSIRRIDCLNALGSAYLFSSTGTAYYFIKEIVQRTTKHKSVGLKITADRIAMLQKSNGNKSLVTIDDLIHEDGSAAGTSVTIRIPVMMD